jgi:hypothetical protein
MRIAFHHLTSTTEHRSGSRWEGECKADADFFQTSAQVLPARVAVVRSRCRELNLMGNEHTTKARTLQGTDETARAEPNQSKKRA